MATATAAVGNGLALTVGGDTYPVLDVSGFGVECAVVDTTTHTDKGTNQGSTPDQGKDWSAIHTRRRKPGSLMWKPITAKVVFDPGLEIPVTGAAAIISLTWFPDSGAASNVVGATGSAEGFVSDFDVSVGYDELASASITWEWSGEPTLTNG